MKPLASWLQGFRDGAPFVMVMAPFALLFGVVGSEAGLNIAEVMGFSVLVVAGASQLAAVQLMVDNAPTVIVIATALAVNLRMAMYSASLVPWLGEAPLWQRAAIAYLNLDQTYATAIAKYNAEPDLPLDARVSYFFGVALAIVPLWFAGSYAGAALGTTIPPEYALDFAIPITFIALIAPMLRSVPHLAAASVSVGTALLLAGLPFNTGLLIAAVVAMATGAEVERRMARSTS